jgi:hypothetical protein
VSDIAVLVVDMLNAYRHRDGEMACPSTMFAVHGCHRRISDDIGETLPGRGHRQAGHDVSVPWDV